MAIDTFSYSLVVWGVRVGEEGNRGFTNCDHAGLARYLLKVTIAAIDTPFIYLDIAWKIPSENQRVSRQVTGTKHYLV